jgi:hypothetical protein
VHQFVRFRARTGALVRLRANTFSPEGAERK